MRAEINKEAIEDGLFPDARQPQLAPHIKQDQSLQA